MSKENFLELEQKVENIIDEKIPFTAMIRKISKGQTFGRPKLIKAGKEFDVFDWIQEGREDTEIYTTLEKYNCIDRMKLDHEALFGDMTEMKDLRGTIEQAKRGQELWNGLPIDVRSEFNNDIANFIENGMDWLKKKIEQKKEKIEQDTIEKQEENINAQ